MLAVALSKNNNRAVRSREQHDHRTFRAYKLLSSAFVRTYLSPATCSPSAYNLSTLPLKPEMISFNSDADNYPASAPCFMNPLIYQSVSHFDCRKVSPVMVRTYIVASAGSPLAIPRDAVDSSLVDVTASHHAAVLSVIYPACISVVMAKSKTYLVSTYAIIKSAMPKEGSISGSPHTLPRHLVYLLCRRSRLFVSTDKYCTGVR